MSRVRINMVGMVGSFWDYMTHSDIIEALANVPDGAEGIDVVINSPGGSFRHGIALFHELNKHPLQVTAHIRGIAASAASLIAMGADQIVMEPGSLMMIHNASGLVEGNKEDLADMVDLLAKVDREMAGIYAKRMGISAKDAMKLMKAETWFTPAEAVAAKLADISEGAGQDGTDTLLNPGIAAIAPLLSVFNYQNVPEEIAALAKPDLVGEPADIRALIKGGSTRARVNKPVALSAGESTEEEEPAMAEEKDHAKESQVQPEPSAPKAASVAEIKAACLEADSDFIVAQIEAGATVEAVKAAWIETLSARLKAEKEKAEANKPGVKALDAGKSASEETSDPEALWADALKAKLAAGLPKVKAIAALVKEQPELHREYLAAVNTSRR